MDYLWSPWRYRYVSQAGKGEGCPFCLKLTAGPAEDRKHLVLYRGQSNFILLNLYPYTTGHILVTPYAHVANLDQIAPEVLTEMMSLAQRAQSALKACYNPEGYNLGMNLGKCAGAGVADHLHLHVLPRWTGDSNFMTVVGETRVQPEDLYATYDKLIAFFPRLNK
ncbi:MAG: HIT domain-containing protein [Acidobacteriota bacterium]|nr:HIT domain-containing protein [Acidobacteriota bacterium]